MAQCLEQKREDGLGGENELMWNWLNCNAGAVQGISAIVSLLLTAGLIGITWWYVRLTKAIAETNQRQLSATLQPLVALEIKCEMYGRDARGLHYDAGGHFTVTNKGSAPLKLKKIFVVVQRGRDWKLHQKEYELEGHGNRVLLPQEELLENYIIVDEVEFNGDWIYGLRIVCTDLPELSRHEFFKHPEKGLRHAFVPPDRVGFFRNVQVKMRRLEAKLDQMAEYHSG